MAHEFPSPADVVRSSADTTRRIAASFRRRGGAWYAEHLEQRAAEAEQWARRIDEIARIRAVPGGLLELQLMADHEAAVRALDAD